MGLKYLLDTNILSEPVEPQPNGNVMKKLEKNSGKFCTSATVWHELNYGIERLDNSKRKNSLTNYLETLLESGSIILPFDQDAGEWLAPQRANLSKNGTSIPYADGEIAAVAATNNLVIVTRNTQYFIMHEHLPVENWFV